MRQNQVRITFCSALQKLSWHTFCEKKVEFIFFSGVRQKISQICSKICHSWAQRENKRSWRKSWEVSFELLRSRNFRGEFDSHPCCTFLFNKIIYRWATYVFLDGIHLRIWHLYLPSPPSPLLLERTRAPLERESIGQSVARGKNLQSILRYEIWKKWFKNCPNRNFFPQRPKNLKFKIQKEFSKKLTSERGEPWKFTWAQEHSPTTWLFNLW